MNEVQISQVNNHASGQANDNDRGSEVEGGINKQHDAASQAQPPEAQGDRGFLFLLTHAPLQQKMCNEHGLCQQSEGEPQALAIELFRGCKFGFIELKGVLCQRRIA